MNIYNVKYTGYIRKIRYYSESSHYIVALLEVEEDQELLTMNGYMSNFNDYDKYAFYGDFEIHLNMVNNLSWIIMK